MFVKKKKKNNLNLKSKLCVLLFINIILLMHSNLFSINNQTFIIKKFFQITKKLNINTNKEIKIGVCTGFLKNGGRARITSILVNYLNIIKLFNIHLFTIVKEDNEYIIPRNVKRIIFRHNLFKLIKQYKIEILIYQLDNIQEINKLNQLKNIKVIIYHHSSIFYWIYDKYYYFKSIYKAFKNSKYFITIVPFENDYLFKKWGIRSILMSNFMTYEYNSVIPSSLSSKTILMIGRGNDQKKRFDIGIKAMKYIVKEIPECQLKIISKNKGINKLENLVNQLNLKKNVQFVGYITKPEIYFKNASLHFFPSISESFGLVLSETKIYGIPSILLGLDYVSIAKGGTIIIYDDKPETLAVEAIKLLKNDKYRKKLGRNARRSIKNFNNKLLFLKWIKVILSIYKGDSYYEDLRKQDKSMSEKYALKILNNQINLLKLRNKKFQNITIKEFENFTFLENIK